MGIEIRVSCLHALQFANKQRIIDNDMEDSAYMTRKLQAEYER